MGRSLGNLKDTAVTAPPAASEPPLDENVTAAQLETRLAELTGKQADLKRRQDAVERELGALRTDDVLGKLDTVGSQRRDALVEQAAVIATDLREITRLKKLSNRWLQDARSREYAGQQQALRDRQIQIQQAAAKVLGELRDELQAVAVDFAATWALGNGESATRASGPDLIRSQIDLRVHREKVIARVAELEQEFGDAD